MRQTALVGSQKRPPICFRELEVASQPAKLPKSPKYFISRAGAYDDDTLPIKNGFHQNFAVLRASPST